MNELSRIKNVLYIFKRIFGHPLRIFRITSTVSDLETGAITQVTEEQTINRAIVLPQKIKRDFQYDLAFVAANKNFTEGGFFDIGRRFVIVDMRDLTTDFRINLNDFCVIDDIKYLIENNIEAEHGLSCLLVLKTVSNYTEIPITSASSSSGSSSS